MLSSISEEQPGPMMDALPMELAVNAVIGKLRSGKHDVVDRAVTKNGKTSRLRWFAVRNAAGDYLGTLEMVQRDDEVVGRPQGQP